MTRLGRYSVRFKRHLRISHSAPRFARFSSDTLSPKIDIAESKDAIDVTAELPGIDEKDLDYGMLTVRGEKRTERDEEDKDKNWHAGGAQLWLVQSSNSLAVRSRPGERRGEVR
jgi:HSP20 family molecular chaperone IbpA